jgi:hypothetical protein
MEIETSPLRSRRFNDAIHRRANRNLPDRFGNIFRSHGLDKYGWQTNLIAIGGGIGDHFDELEELSCVEDRGARITLFREQENRQPA